MKKYIIGLTIACSLGIFAISQSTPAILLQGNIVDKSSNRPVINATIRVNGKGYKADTLGHFRVPVPTLPITMLISSAEYESIELVVRTSNEVTIGMESIAKQLDPVVMGANRVRNNLIRTPVTIERIGLSEIINSPSSPCEIMSSKKGIDVTTSSMTYKTYSTRGFNGSGSSRVNQLMDGMDNQAPGMNFSIGNFIGLTDLDIESIEILPGASSALYGPGGMNGTILVSSKSPFKYPGLSIIAKTGVTDIGKDQRGRSGTFHDYSFRWAQKISDRFAFKLGGQYLESNDWLANDSNNYLRTAGKVVPGTRQSDPNYDGVNVYGDETKGDLRGFMMSDPTLFARFLTTPQYVSRTGFNEIDVIDPKTKNLKISTALHYRFNKDLEGIFAGYYGTGNTVYSGNNRYAFKGIKMGQYKLELKHTNWFLRGYTTQENAGEAYSATVTSQYVNEAWKRSLDMSNINGSWYPQYFGAFATGARGIYNNARANGATIAQAQDAVYVAASQLHSAGRAFADRDRPVPGSAQFKQIFDQVRKIPIPNGGLFLDKSDLWMGEGQYNFTNRMKFADILVGANVKKYVLNSQGTLFIDTAGALKINEWGAYSQITKKLLDDKLVLSASARYDKNQNFKGKFTPRVTALFSVAKDHNIRMSYQTAYKFPTTQQQWIRLDVGNAFLLGGLPWIKDYMSTESNSTFVVDPNTGSVSPYIYKELKPESVRSFEIGYKSIINKKLLVDAYVYFGKYTDFLGRIILIQPPNININKPYSVVTNSDTKVKTWGMGIGFDYKMNNNYFMSLNGYTDELTNVPAGFEAGFNTPKYRMNAGFGNSGLGTKKRIGFNINLRAQDDFYWEGAGLANGNVKAYTTIDAQVNYKFPKIGSMIKIGGNNITNKFYQTGFGNPYIGGLYYISFGYQIF